MDLKASIREVPDFPKKGILFYDITTLLADPLASEEVIGRLARPYSVQKIQKVVGVESRGFIFGMPVAGHLKAGFIPVRKPGKLPHETIETAYDLEYGSDNLCMHRDAIVPGERVLIVDDLLATGGTMEATVKLVQKLGGEIIGIAFVIELLFLNGRDKLPGLPVTSLLTYE